LAAFRLILYSQPDLSFLASPGDPGGALFIEVRISGTQKASFICCCYFVTGEEDCLLTAAFVSPSPELMGICLCTTQRQGIVPAFLRRRDEKRYSKMMLYLLTRMLSYK